MVVDLLIGVIAAQHVLFLILEMFLWTKPVGLKVFRMDRARAEASAVLARNQGLYNGFLAAGLVWSLTAADPRLAFELKTFFLACVVTAGVFGGATASWGILAVQGFPAAAALAILFISR
jgi:putative membrane protein